MKIIAVGDIHGRDFWKRVAEKEIGSCDKFIFIGDYFDTHYDVTAEAQLDNFHQIILFKKKFIDKVVLLIGNHDFHYMNGAGQQYSGYQPGAAPAINRALEEAWQDGCLQMCYYQDNVLFSHAGITNTWLEKHDGKAESGEQVALFVNELFIAQRRAFRFSPGKAMDNSGDEICQTPIWVRPRALMRDGCLPKTVTHVVGHTSQGEIVKAFWEYPDKGEDKPPGFVLIDAADAWEYLAIVDGKFNVEEYV